MRVIALIPARIGSTRFPRKMLADIKGKSLIRRTYESVAATGLFADVYVVTDSDEIKEEIEQCGGHVIKSKTEHETGTDRIAEAVADIDADIIINVQGDEPFISKEPLAKLINLFKEEGSKLEAGTLVHPSTDHIAINNPNRVKVLMREDRFAIYFTRSLVPFVRNKMIPYTNYLHVGIYAFRKEALLKFAAWEPRTLEKVEQLECNRFIEYGMPVKLAVTEYEAIAVDAPEDILKAENYIEGNNLE